MIELTALLIFLAAGWFWLDSLRARDFALDGARKACESEGVQLLDWTVAMKRIRLGRDDEGRRGFQRTYEFEFSDTGNKPYRRFHNGDWPAVAGPQSPGHCSAALQRHPAALRTGLRRAL